MALLLSFQSITKSYGVRTLFSDISLSLSDGEHIGLIGPNGSGKSTLLKIIAALEHADSGQATARRGLRLGYLAQEDEFPAGASVNDVLMGALPDTHQEPHERQTQAAIMLTRMGFTDPDQLADALSGGWKKRLALGRELIKQPDLLLLDEPTNHLDMQAITWMEELLANAPFAFLLVTHDRYLLEGSTNRTIELSRAYPQGFLSIEGKYSTFLEKKEDFLEAQASQQTAMESRVKREIQWLRRGAKARTTKAKGRIEAAKDMMGELAELKVRNTQDRSATIDFTATQRQTRKLVTVKGISKTLGGRLLFKDLDLVLSPGMKLGLLGANGCGKTTLLRLLAGQLEPDTGQIRPAEGLRIVYFQQNREQMDRSQTLRQALAPRGDTVFYREAAIHISSWAKQFLFKTEQLDMPVADLSGGEQSRVLIARLMLQPADLLMMDEPTNDLDINTLDVLEESLDDFAGALVLVTHDRYLVDSLCTDILGLDGNAGASLYGDYSQWQAAQTAAAQAAAAAARKPANKPQTPAPIKPPAKRLTYMELREWEQIESNIMAAEAELESAREQMNDPTVLADHSRLNEVCHAVDAAEKRVRQLYARWEELDAKRNAV